MTQGCPGHTVVQEFRCPTEQGYLVRSSCGARVEACSSLFSNSPGPARIPASVRSQIWQLSIRSSFCGASMNWFARHSPVAGCRARPTVEQLEPRILLSTTAAALPTRFALDVDEPHRPAELPGSAADFGEKPFDGDDACIPNRDDRHSTEDGFHAAHPMAMRPH